MSETQSSVQVPEVPPGGVTYRARIGVELRAGATPGPALLLSEPMFGLPPSNPDARADQRSSARKVDGGPQPPKGPAPTGLGRFLWVTGTYDDVRADPAVARVWREAPPCPTPAFPEPRVGVPSDADSRLARARAALHREGTGVGVRIAIVERAWSDAVAALPNVTAEPLLPGLDPAYASHADLTVATIRGAGGVQGLAPGAELGLFTCLRAGPTGEPYDDVAGAIARAADWLGPQPTGLRGCVAVWLGSSLRHLAWIPGLVQWLYPRGQGILLVELQHLLGIHQIDDLDADDRTYRSPGGWTAAGPVDADPGVAEAVRYASDAGHLVVIPAGNGHRRLDHVSDDGGTGVGKRLDADGHRGLRVGACDEDRRYPLSNHADGAVEIAAPGFAVGAATVVGGGWSASQWGGTSAASAIVAGIAACLRSGGSTTDGVRERLLRGGTRIAGIGVRPSWLG